MSEASSTSIEALYKAFQTIAESSDKLSHKKEFLQILAASKGDSNAKRLCSQFVAKLFKDFADMHEQAYNCMIDLIEDEDVMIRKQVITDFPKLSKDVPAYVAKIADILVQMLQTDDPQELVLVQSSLVHLLNQDLMQTLRGVFAQIHQEEVPEVTRERAVRFLANKLKVVDVTPKAEEFIIEQTNKALEDVSEDEFIFFVRILSSLKSMQTLKGRQKLVDMILVQADLESPFDPTDISCIGRLRECSNQVLPFLSKNINAQKFVIYFLDQVLPKLHLIPRETEDQKPRLDLLRSFAELSSHAGTGFTGTDEQLMNAVEAMKLEMPLPPDPVPEEGPKEDELNFSEVECLLFGFLQVSSAKFLTENTEKLAEFKKRLQYFAQANQRYLKSLKTALDAAKDLKDPSNRMKVTALRLTNNIHTLIKDLFKNPPGLQPEMALSWRPVESRKRPAIYEEASGPKQRRADRRPYQPPAGKFSERAGKAPAGDKQGYGRSRYYNPGGGRGRRW